MGVSDIGAVRGQPPFLIVGLGNPGREYEHTRHNVGFDTVAALAGDMNVRLQEKQFHSESATCTIAGRKCILVRPHTFMNVSGIAVKQFARYYKVDPETSLLVISDDIHLELGRLRIRAGGSAGGHNGLGNIIEQLGTDRFARLRIGVGHLPEHMDQAKYVLSHFDKNDKPVITAAEHRAAEAARDIIEHGVEHAMNLYNKQEA